MVAGRHAWPLAVRVRAGLALISFLDVSSPVTPTLALSSCWNSFRHNDGYAMLREIADQGFTHAELSHGIRIVLVPGILKAVEEGWIKISSTHNFCPLPAGITQAAPNLFEPSARHVQESAQWLRHTKRSIEFAAQVKAAVCVLHLGSVKFWLFHPANKLKAFIKANPNVTVPEDSRFQRVLRAACAKMRAKMPEAWTQVQASLAEISAHALAKGVKLGCENRERFEELPVDDDFEALFAALPHPHPYGYWHDTGHADLKASLGLLNHRAHLARNAPRLLGFHLHDVNAKGKDHQALGDGRIDFSMVSEFWQPHHLLTLELSPRVSVEGVVRSRARVLELMSQRFG
jgi:hypothetical protein